MYSPLTYANCPLLPRFIMEHRRKAHLVLTFDFCVLTFDFLLHSHRGEPQRDISGAIPHAPRLVISPQLPHPVVRLARRFGDAKSIHALGDDAHGRLQ